MTPILDVRDLRVYYGKIEALHGVSLRVEEGAIVTVIGPNGAGKTTLLSAIMGLLPCSGGIRFAGNEFAGTKVHTRVARGASLVPERRELFGELSVEDNLRLGAFQRVRRGERGADREPEIVFLVALDYGVSAKARLGVCHSNVLRCGGARACR